MFRMFASAGRTSAASGGEDTGTQPQRDQQEGSKLRVGSGSRRDKAARKRALRTLFSRAELQAPLSGNTANLQAHACVHTRLPSDGTQDGGKGKITHLQSHGSTDVQTLSRAKCPTGEEWGRI